MERVVAAMSIGPVRRDDTNLLAGVGLDPFNLFWKLPPFAGLARCHRHIDDNPCLIVDGSMLLKTGLHTVLLARGRHGGVGVGGTVTLRFFGA